MFKIDYPKIIIILESFNEFKELQVIHNDQIFVLGKTTLKIEHQIKSINDVVQIKFKNFIPEDTKQKILIKIYHNEIEKDSLSLCTFFMKDNLYVHNTKLENYNCIYYNGTLQIKFFKRWFECNILEGHQILDKKDLPVQWIMDYNDCSLRITPKIQIYDVICLGCSYTFGLGLQNDETWPTILQKKTKLTVGNFGTAGCGIDGIYRQFLYVKKHFKFKKILVLLPGFYRKRQKFYFGDFQCELLVTSQITSKIISQKNLTNLIKKLFYRERIGKKYIDLLAKQDNILISSWDDEVYKNIPASKKMSRYPNLKMFKERATDKVHPSQKHNEFFVDRLLNEGFINANN